MKNGMQKCEASLFLVQSEYDSHLKSYAIACFPGLK